MTEFRGNSDLAIHMEFTPRTNIQRGRLALNGTFTIFYFISNYDDGHAPGSVDQYLVSPSLAAVTHIFAAPTNMCDNCGRQDEQALAVTNTSAITSLLLDYIKKGEKETGGLADLEPENVKPFLEKRLKWRVLQVSFNRELSLPFP